MTTTPMAHPKRRTATVPLALCVLTALSGCATGGATSRTAAPAAAAATAAAAGLYTFTIRFGPSPVNAAPSCPVEASMEQAKRNCANAKADCVKARRSDRIVFQAAGATIPPFAIHFDPFKQTALPMTGGTASFTIDADAPLQTYYFFVTSPGCPPLDPQIIVE